MSFLATRQSVLAAVFATLLTLGPGARGAHSYGLRAVINPPAIGDLVVSDDLTGPRIFAPDTCPHGVGLGQNVGEGFILKAWGRCIPNRTTVDIAIPARGILMLDGDVSLDFKIATGGARTGFNLYLRNRIGSSLGMYLNPTTGESSLFHLSQGSATPLTETYAASAYAVQDDWNHVSLRIRGNDVWLVLNETPLLFGSGAPTEVGGIGIRLFREGGLDDNQESGVVFRNLTVSSLAGGDPSRGPTYQAP